MSGRTSYYPELAKDIAPAKGRLGVLLPGLGAVSTTLRRSIAARVPSGDPAGAACAEPIKLTPAISAPASAILRLRIATFFHGPIASHHAATAQELICFRFLVVSEHGIEGFGRGLERSQNHP